MESHYCHLKLDERRKLAKWLEAKLPVSEIADRLGRGPSTIYRDIKRNRYRRGQRAHIIGEQSPSHRPDRMAERTDLSQNLAKGARNRHLGGKDGKR